jgi:23S rRNA pseudouridine2605 synthase
LIKKATAGVRPAKAGGTGQRPARGAAPAAPDSKTREPRVRGGKPGFVIREARSGDREARRGDRLDRNGERIAAREAARKADRTADTSPGGTKTRSDRERDFKSLRDKSRLDKPRGEKPPGEKPRVGSPERRDRSASRDQPMSEREAQRLHRLKPSAPASARPPRVRIPTGPAVADTSGSPLEPMRIAKAVARAGLCSRRDAERWIAEGRVVVNGRTLSSPALDVGPTDRILVDGAPLPAAEPAQVWRYYKPRGLVTTHSDPEGRPTVFDNLPPDLPRVVSIGRLDFNTEGLLLLTNDGALARHLELPATGWLRRYRVRAHGRVSQSDLDGLKDGVTIDGVAYGGIEAKIDSVQSGNMWLTIGLREGKNREVRRILGSLALEVNRLIRVSYGPFQLMELEPGGYEPVKRRVLADQLGPDAARFGLTGAIEGYKARQARTPGGKPGAKVREE